MKITHICLCGPVTDGFSYQDNLLPKYHLMDGHDVTVITSQFIWGVNGQLAKDDRKEYYNEYGIKVIRLLNKVGKSINSKLKIYENFYNVMERTTPDILFVHGIQFLDIIQVIRYKKKYPAVKVFIDNHADFSNSANNWLSKNILHKIIWRFFANKAKKYTDKFYGVLPARVDFLVDVYKLPKEKVELLVMGADDDEVISAQNESSITNIKSKYNIEENDFLIVTGGKIDSSKKQTILLMEAIKEMKNENFKLIIFGSVVEELKAQVLELCDGKQVQFIGWLNNQETYQHLAAADLVIFPGRHSVLWEQVVGLGKPLIVKYWNGSTHVDLGGNCEFLYQDSKNEMMQKINEIYFNKDKYEFMKKISEERGIEVFSYKNIAKRCIQ